MTELPPHVQEKVQRILDGAARRMLDEAIAEADETGEDLADVVRRRYPGAQFGEEDPGPRE